MSFRELLEKNKPIIQRRKILMVDDEEQLTKLTKRNLEMAGPYEVRTINRASQALNAAKEFRPDVILLDVMMPEADGGEVAATILAESDLSNTPILFLTAAIKKSEDGQDRRKIGGRTYIAKPIKADRLLAYIEEALK